MTKIEESLLQTYSEACIALLIIASAASARRARFLASASRTSLASANGGSFWTALIGTGWAMAYVIQLKKLNQTFLVAW